MAQDLEGVNEEILRRRREVYLEVGADGFDTAPDGVDALAEFAALFGFLFGEAGQGVGPDCDVGVCLL